MHKHTFIVCRRLIKALCTYLHGYQPQPVISLQLPSYYTTTTTGVKMNHAQNYRRPLPSAGLLAIIDNNSIIMTLNIMPCGLVLFSCK